MTENKKGRRDRKGSVFPEVVKRQIRGGRLQVGVRGKVERQQERRGDRDRQEGDEDRNTKGR